MSPAASAGAVRRGEQPPLDTALRRSIRIAAAKADAAHSRPFPSMHPEQDHHMNPVAIDPTVRRAEQATELQTRNRTLEMHLLQENLARAHMQQRLQEAEHERTAVRLARATRLARRAERASMRARRALALVVM